MRTRRSPSRIAVSVRTSTRADCSQISGASHVPRMIFLVFNHLDPQNTARLAISALRVQNLERRFGRRPSRAPIGLWNSRVEAYCRGMRGRNMGATPKHLQRGSIMKTPLSPPARCSKAIVRISILLCAVCTGSSYAEKRYGPGVSDTEIRIGQTMPYSGPLSAFGTIGRAQSAYFDMVNERGG